MRRNNEAGIQKPRTIITKAKPTTEDFFHRQVSPGGSPGSGPRTKLAIWIRNPEKIATRKVVKRIAKMKWPPLKPARRMVNSLRNKLNGGAPVTARVTMRNAAPVIGME